MKELFRKIQPYTGKIFAVLIVLFFSYLAYSLYNAPVDGIEEKFVYLLKKEESKNPSFLYISEKLIILL